MYENYRLEDVKNIFKTRLKDYSLFKKYVSYTSFFTVAGIVFLAISSVGLMYNIKSIFRLITLQVDFDYLDTFQKIIYVIIIISLYFFINGIVLIIIGLLRKDSNYQKIYNEFISNPVINHKQLVKINKNYSLVFKNNEDTRRMISLIKDNVFEDNKKYKKMVKNRNFITDPTRLSDYLKENYGFTNEIESVEITKSKKILNCYEGDYLLYVEAFENREIIVKKFIKDQANL